MSKQWKHPSGKLLKSLHKSLIHMESLSREGYKGLANAEERRRQERGESRCVTHITCEVSWCTDTPDFRIMGTRICKEHATEIRVLIRALAGKLVLHPIKIPQ